MAQPTSTVVCTGNPNAVYSKCRCPSHRASRAWARKADQAGILYRVGDVEFRAILRLLQVRQLTAAQIAEGGGLNTQTVRRILREHRIGRERMVTQGTRLAFRRAERATRGLRPPLIDATGTRRRLQALGFMGHDANAISRVAVRSDGSRVPRGRIEKIRSGYSRWTSPEVADAVGRAYDVLWDVRVDNQRSLGATRRNGWVSPLAWDDDEIDDPLATPYTGDVDTDPLALIAERHAAGWNLEAIAEFMDVKPGSILRRLERNGMKELLDALRAGRLGSINPTGRKVSA